MNLFFSELIAKSIYNYRFFIYDPPNITKEYIKKRSKAHLAVRNSIILAEANVGDSCKLNDHIKLQIDILKLKDEVARLKDVILEKDNIIKNTRTYNTSYITFLEQFCGFTLPNQQQEFIKKAKQP